MSNLVQKVHESAKDINLITVRSFAAVSRFQQNTTDITNYHTTMEALPDLSAMDKQALASLVMELYERSCKVFGDTFDIQHQVRVGCFNLKVNIV